MIRARKLNSLDTMSVYRAELIDILRDYGDRENEDHYTELSDADLVDEFKQAAHKGRERVYVRESAEDIGFDWHTLTTRIITKDYDS